MTKKMMFSVVAVLHISSILQAMNKEIKIPSEALLRTCLYEKGWSSFDKKCNISARLGDQELNALEISERIDMNIEIWELSNTATPSKIAGIQWRKPEIMACILMNSPKAYDEFKRQFDKDNENKPRRRQHRG